MARGYASLASWHSLSRAERWWILAIYLAVTLVAVAVAAVVTLWLYGRRHTPLVDDAPPRGEVPDAADSWPASRSWLPVIPGLALVTRSWIATAVIAAISAVVAAVMVVRRMCTRHRPQGTAPIDDDARPAPRTTHEPAASDSAARSGPAWTPATTCPAPYECGAYGFCYGRGTSHRPTLPPVFWGDPERYGPASSTSTVDEPGADSTGGPAEQIPTAANAEMRRCVPGTAASGGLSCCDALSLAPADSPSRGPGKQSCRPAGPLRSARSLTVHP